jgi:hypothetical protein
MDYGDPESSKEHLSLVRKAIREVKKIQNDHHVFVLVEIAAMEDAEFVHLDVESKEKVRNQLAVPGCFEFDAALFSPMSRKSTLFTNIAITGSMVSPSGTVCFP